MSGDPEVAPGDLDPDLLGPGAERRSAGAELSPGQTLGPWRVIDLIAAGGMGSVYLGERIDQSFSMKVASAQKESTWLREVAVLTRGPIWVATSPATTTASTPEAWMSSASR